MSRFLCKLLSDLYLSHLTVLLLFGTEQDVSLLIRLKIYCVVSVLPHSRHPLTNWFCLGLYLTTLRTYLLQS